MNDFTITVLSTSIVKLAIISLVMSMITPGGGMRGLQQTDAISHESFHLFLFFNSLDLLFTAPDLVNVEWVLNICVNMGA